MFAGSLIDGRQMFDRCSIDVSMDVRGFPVVVGGCPVDVGGAPADAAGLPVDSQ